MFLIHNQTVVVVDLMTVTSCNQPLDAECATMLWLTMPVLTIRCPSRNSTAVTSQSCVTMLTNAQLLSTGARFRLENLGCGWTSCIHVVHIWQCRRNLVNRSTTARVWLRMKNMAMLYAQAHFSHQILYNTISLYRDSESNTVEEISSFSVLYQI